MKNQSKNHKREGRSPGKHDPLGAWHPHREVKDVEDGEGRRCSHQETRAGTNDAF